MPSMPWGSRLSFGEGGGGQIERFAVFHENLEGVYNFINLGWGAMASPLILWAGMKFRFSILGPFSPVTLTIR